MRAEFEYLGTNRRLLPMMYSEFHTHSKYELIYYFCGEGCVNCKIGMFAYTPGSLLIVPPGTMHDEFHLRETECTFILFSLDDDSLFPNPCIYNGMGERIENMIRELCSEWASDALFHAEKQSAMLTLLLIELLRAERNRCAASDGQPAGAHPSEKLMEVTGKGISTSIGYSYERYRHVFKEKTGVSPHQFVIQTRIEKAKYLLKYTTLSISEIAQSSGFSSSSYFAMQFKKHVGITPSAYRETK